MSDIMGSMPTSWQYLKISFRSPFHWTTPRNLSDCGVLATIIALDMKFFGRLLTLFWESCYMLMWYYAVLWSFKHIIASGRHQCTPKRRLDHSISLHSSSARCSPNCWAFSRDWDDRSHRVDGLLHERNCTLSYLDWKLHTMDRFPTPRELPLRMREPRIAHKPVSHRPEGSAVTNSTGTSRDFQFCTSMVSLWSRFERRRE